jgi:hypothetical protein
MTTDKALKRDIRARMTKTGESYTTARHFLLDEHLEEPIEVDELIRVVDARTPPWKEPGLTLPPRVAEPGMSDEAIQKSTGNSWDEWFVILDSWGATNRKHAEIAKYIGSQFDISGWWAQNVTVGYERARGMRKINEHVDGYSVNVSRTFAFPVERVYRAFASDEERETWLEPDLIKVRTFTEDKVWRCEILENKSRVEARFTVKSPEKCSVQIEHAKLPDEADVATWRAFWKQHLDRLTEALS